MSRGHPASDASGAYAAPPQGRYWLDRQSVLGPVLLLPAVIYIIALVGIPLVLACSTA